MFGGLAVTAPSRLPRRFVVEVLLEREGGDVRWERSRTLSPQLAELEERRLRALGYPTRVRQVQGGDVKPRKPRRPQIDARRKEQRAAVEVLITREDRSDVWQRSRPLSASAATRELARLKRLGHRARFVSAEDETRQLNEVAPEHEPRRTRR